MSRPIPPLAADDHILGTPSFSVTLVEYGDYQCPYCGEAYPVLKAVQRAMDADLRFVFRNFPLVEVHAHALRAAQFAEAAAEAGLFWEAHDMLTRIRMPSATATLRPMLINWGSTGPSWRPRSKGVTTRRSSGTSSAACGAA